jgi:hypothetical protein
LIDLASSTALREFRGEGWCWNSPKDESVLQVVCAIEKNVRFVTEELDIEKKV